MSAVGRVRRAPAGSIGLRGVALLLVATLVAGCSVALRTRPADISACDAALVEGLLARSSETGAGLLGNDGSVQPIAWPFGYAARIGIGGLELLDETGATVAREGDRISAGGGEDGNGVFVVCPGSVQVQRQADGP